ncbi:MAG: 2-amino-4-hydroxy-6-hydroxymethyldihydropteridine diphosphokinase [Spirochaetaceae bacterium]|nr:2-amino-4-hydroxy-6-hydroxymethyldihydropteridine diphosphokinase [Spirochaetaceae bacterium]
MDSIIVKGLKFYAKHGVLEAEKEMGQFFSLDVKIYLETVNSDDAISKTVHYGQLASEAVKFCSTTRFDLIETLVNKLSTHLLIKYPLIEKIDLTLHKPHAPITENFEDVLINIVRERVVCYLALGSNIGDTTAHLNSVKKAIENNPNIELLKSSTYIITPPYGVVDQPDFLNAVIKIRTIFSITQLLDFTQSLEESANRVKLRHWGERTLDVDILFYSNIVYFSDSIIIPHPQIALRAFVLEPMCEIEPFFIHPVFKKDMRTLLLELNN